jgi:hypothetical protein
MIGKFDYSKSIIEQIRITPEEILNKAVGVYSITKFWSDLNRTFERLYDRNEYKERYVREMVRIGEVDDLFKPEVLENPMLMENTVVGKLYGKYLEDAILPSVEQSLGEFLRGLKDKTIFKQTIGDPEYKANPKNNPAFNKQKNDYSNSEYYFELEDSDYSTIYDLGYSDKQISKISQVYILTDVYSRLDRQIATIKEAISKADGIPSNYIEMVFDSLDKQKFAEYSYLTIKESDEKKLPASYWGFFSFLLVPLLYNSGQENLIEKSSF